MNYEQEAYLKVNPEVIKINRQQIEPLDHQAYEDLYYRERDELPPRLRGQDEPGNPQE